MFINKPSIIHACFWLGNNERPSDNSALFEHIIHNLKLWRICPKSKISCFNSLHETAFGKDTQEILILTGSQKDILICIYIKLFLTKLSLFGVDRDARKKVKSKIFFNIGGSFSELSSDSFIFPENWFPRAIWFKVIGDFYIWCSDLTSLKG